jgi:hypothetical protein
MTFAKLKQGIVDKLFETFGASKVYYTEIVDTDFAFGSFFVNSITSVNNEETGTRAFRSYSFDILYFPSSLTAPKSESENIFDTLTDKLNYISVDGGLYLGNEISARYDDSQKVGHFFVTYSFFVMDENVDKDKMEKVDFI